MVSQTPKCIVKVLKMFVGSGGPGPFQRRHHHQEPPSGPIGQG